MVQMQGDGKGSSILPPVKLGRPKKVRREGETILSNGWYERQWQRIQREAALVPVDAAVYQRIVMDWWFDHIDASRSGTVATPEQDKSFEKLISVASNNHKKSKLRRKK